MIEYWIKIKGSKHRIQRSDCIIISRDIVDWEDRKNLAAVFK